MCDIGSAILAGSLAVKVGGELLKAKAQNQQSNAARDAAARSEQANMAQLNLRADQERQAASMSIMQADRQARIAEGAAKVQAGEGGVSGVSVDALLGDITRQRLEFQQNTNINLNNTLDQITAEKQGVHAQALNQAAAYPRANPLATGLNIFGDALDYAGVLIQRRNNATPKPPTP